MSNNTKLLLSHLDLYNKNNFIYKLHEDDMFSTSLFFEFILEVHKYKKLDEPLKIELVHILLYFLTTLMYHFDPDNQSITKLPKNFHEKMPNYVDIVEFLILKIVACENIDNNYVIDWLEE
ncbi:hypothetical protein CRYPA_228 [uncultured Candidatus Thioglobus sp.]|nr:hypothetical protein CRYPA_228 [uncultured Candidatus Thioglobus sp.]